MRWTVILTVFIVMLVYALIGGVIFHFIESQHEKDVEGNLRQRQEAFQDAHPCYNLSRMLKFHILMKKAEAAGLHLNRATRQIVNQTNWDVANSIFFTSQLIGAVGYGTMTPQTVGGKLFLVFFAAIGIPLFIIFAFGVGRPIARLVRYLERRLCGPWVLHDRAMEPTPVPQTKEDKRIIKKLAKLRWFWVYFLRIGILFVFGSIFFVLIPAIVFNAIEPWNYGESVYYCYTTVLSIGFGDFVPGDATEKSYRSWYRLVTSIYVYIGVAFFVVVFYPLKEAMNFRKAINTPLTFSGTYNDGLPEITDGDDDTDGKRLRYGWGSTRGKKYRSSNPYPEYSGAYAGPPRVGSSPYVAHAPYAPSRHAWSSYSTGNDLYGTDNRYALSGDGLKLPQPGVNRVAQGKATSLVVNSSD